MLLLRRGKMLLKNDHIPCRAFGVQHGLRKPGARSFVQFSQLYLLLGIPIQGMGVSRFHVSFKLIIAGHTRERHRFPAPFSGAKEGPGKVTLRA